MDTTAAVRGKPQNRTRDMVYIALFAVITAIGSWISIPTTVPFTLQTFSVFITLTVLGGKRGTLSILLYILLGAVGIPVFAGFKGGVGVLLGNTGGYILGFLATGLVFWGMEKIFGKNWRMQVFSLILGLAVCYAFGTVWFLAVYMQTAGSVGLMTVLGWCVLPFVIPDLVKLALAMAVSRRISRYAEI